MFAQTKQDQANKFTVYTPESLPEPVADLFKKISHHQLILQNFLSKALAPSERNLSTHLKMFLTESKDRLHCFIVTFDEIVTLVSDLRQQEASLVKNIVYSLSAFPSAPKAIKEIFAAITLLCDMFEQLKDKIETSKIPVFVKDFIQKSLIFYKQTQVVLKGYLRTFKVQKSDSW